MSVSPGFGVTIFKHLQSANVILIHSHITHGERTEIVHHTAAWPFHHVDQLATQLQCVDLEVDLEECIRDGEEGQPFRASAVLGYGGKALCEIVQRLTEELVVSVASFVIRLKVQQSIVKRAIQLRNLVWAGNAPLLQGF